eukprot:scaffold324_cov212-Chaetoceros_neogracile.AAC.2
MRKKGLSPLSSEEVWWRLFVRVISHQEDLQELFDPNLSITALLNSKLMFIIDIFEIAAANANLYL